MGGKKSNFSDMFRSCKSYIYILPSDISTYKCGLAEAKLLFHYWFYLSLLTYSRTWLMATKGLFYQQQVSVYTQPLSTNAGREVGRGGWG